MTARPKRRHIKDLAEKLDFLSRDEAAQKINGCSGVSDLARRCNINVSTFKNLKSKVAAERTSPDHKGTIDLISSDHERAITNYCRFRLDWPEWVTGTAEAFKQRYLREVKAVKAQESEERRSDIPLFPRYSPQRARGRLAVLKMEAVLSNSSEQWPVKIALYCRDDNGYGICSGLVDLDCGEAHALRSECSFHQPYDVPGTNGTLRLGAGPEHKPSWTVKARSGILDDVAPEEPYCIVRGLSPGDTITASFSICVKDFPGAGKSLCGADGRPVTGPNKKLLLERIMAAALAHNDAGEVVLCSHAVTFEDAQAGLPAKVMADG
jgi:hypothetical protein